MNEHCAHLGTSIVFRLIILGFIFGLVAHNNAIAQTAIIYDTQLEQVMQNPKQFYVELDKYESNREIPLSIMATDSCTWNRGFLQTDGEVFCKLEGDLANKGTFQSLVLGIRQVNSSALGNFYSEQAPSREQGKFEIFEWVNETAPTGFWDAEVTAIYRPVSKIIELHVRPRQERDDLEL